MSNMLGYSIYTEFARIKRVVEKQLFACRKEITSQVTQDRESMMQ